MIKLKVMKHLFDYISFLINKELFAIDNRSIGIYLKLVLVKNNT
jgi:hypothetical protein